MAWQRMALQNLLQQNQELILKRWFELILESYPENTANLMREGKNQFTNPVGSTFSREIEVLFKNLCGGDQLQKCRDSLDSILKIRSVQDFSPSKAVGFIFLLKRAIERILKDEISKEPITQEWLKFQGKIDGLALEAFDVYMDCRDKICEIRVKEAKAEKKMAFKMMERMAKK